MKHLRDALSLYRKVGDRRGEAKALNNLGRMHLYCGYHRDALDGVPGVPADLHGDRRRRRTRRSSTTTSAACTTTRAATRRAWPPAGEALAIYRDIGDLPDEADVLNDIGAIYQSAACYDEALVHHQKARQIAEEIGDLSQQLIALRQIADILRGSGRQRRGARALSAPRCRLAREIGDPYEEGKILEGIAESTLSTQRPDAARIVFRQALDIFERLGVPEAESARIRIETMDLACRPRIA